MYVACGIFSRSSYGHIVSVYQNPLVRHELLAIEYNSSEEHYTYITWCYEVSSNSDTEIGR